MTTQAQFDIVVQHVTNLLVNDPILNQTAHEYAVKELAAAGLSVENLEENEHVESLYYSVHAQCLASIVSASLSSLTNVIAR